MRGTLLPAEPPAAVGLACPLPRSPVEPPAPQAGRDPNRSPSSETMRPTTELQRGPAEQPSAIGIDQAPERRPGVPMEAEPSIDAGAHWRVPERMPERRLHLHRKGLRRLTPVYGTAQPPRGVSGLMRRFAYRIPEHRARHWALLLAADRVDVFEGRLGEALASPLRRTPLAPLAGQVEKNPVRALGVTFGALLAARMLVRRAFD